MTELYQFKCSKCGEVVRSTVFESDDCPACDDKYAAMMPYHTAEHDKEIMEEPTFSCPDCGESAFAFALEHGKDWKCRRQSGGCGFVGWVEEDRSIPAPDDLGDEEATRQNAWSRYQRSQIGTYEYRD